MSYRSIRERLSAQLLDLQRVKKLAAGHPLMMASIAQKEEEISERIASIPHGKKEAKTILSFYGAPVQGSIGIDASFASRVLEPFQAMVMADYADRWYGGLGSRGRRTGETKSKLLLSGLPRGSVGLELTRANDDLFPEDNLADTLSHVARLIESSVKSDADFAAEIAQAEPRLISNLKEFLGVISKGDAGLNLETGDIRLLMTPSQAVEAYNRVASARTDENTVEIVGVFKGALLASWDFDFVTDEGYTIKGKVDEVVSEEQLAGMSKQFLNKTCVAIMLKITVTFRNGVTRIRYVLKGLRT